MINGRQIRAARALLEWDAKDLATKTGLSLDAIFKIENGVVQARGGSIEKIIGVFNDGGVEFLGSHGVQWIQHQVRTLAGVDGLKTFFDDVRAVVKRAPEEIVICGVEEEYLEKKLGEYLDYHRHEMTTFGNVKMRCLVEENDFDLGASDYCQYRWLPKENFSNVPFYIYGDKMAIIVTTAPEAPLILLIQNRAIAHAYKKQFETIWATALEPKKRRSKK